MVSRLGDYGAFALRKVGAPQSRMLANGQSGQPEGKCHRKQTADDSISKTGKDETVR